MLHSLAKLQMVLHNPHPWRVVLNSQLTKAIGEREQSSTITMVSTRGRRTGRMRGAISPNGINLDMLARVRLNDVAVLT